MDDDASPETLEQIQARHRKEAKDLQSRITSKKKNATKKTRRGVNSECEELERALKERQSAEISALNAEEEEEEEGHNSDVDDELGATVPQDSQEHAATTEVVAADGSREKEEIGSATKPQPPQSQQPQQQQQGGGGGEGGKKRNRQKERLARRAAETEAAALAAEQEALTQTDHRALEKQRMLAKLAQHSLVEHEIRPDGHCLFSAVADQLAQLGVPLDDDNDDHPPRSAPGETGPGAGYKVVRRRAATYIGEHAAEYGGFLEEDVDDYVRKMRDTAEWGGQIELAAVANVWGVEVWVVQDGETEVVRPSEAAAAAAGSEERPRLWLAYYRHGYGLGEHYNSLRKKA